MIGVDISVCLILILNIIACKVCSQTTDKILLPTFTQLRDNYPGYKLFGGKYSHRKLLDTIDCDRSHLVRDTSALRLSFTLNKLGNPHELGRTPIKLSKNGQDSVTGSDGFEFMYHPLAYGPFLVDKYGYPNISTLHQTDPIATKDKFWGKQGIIQIVTFTRRGNRPRCHIGLWDCDHFHEAKDWIGKHSLITVQFWASPDSDCSHMLQKKASTGSFHLLPAHPLKETHRATPKIYNHVTGQDNTVISAISKPSPQTSPNSNKLQINQNDKNIFHSHKEIKPPTILNVKGIKFRPLQNARRWTLIRWRRKRLNLKNKLKSSNETFQQKKKTKKHHRKHMHKFRRKRKFQF